MVAVFSLLVVDMSDTSTIGFLDHLSTKKCQLGWAFWENVVWQGKKNQTHIFTLVLKAHTSMSNFLSSLIYQNIINITSYLFFMNNKGINLPPSEIGLAIIAAFPIQIIWLMHLKGGNLELLSCPKIKVQYFYSDSGWSRLTPGCL